MGIFDRFPYSSTHEMNLDFMLGKATEIAESLQKIDTHKEQAEQAATNAAQSAQSAAQAAQAAAGSQTAAGTSASQAAQHKADAEDAADRAEAASDLADEAVTQAQTAAQNASTAADGAIASAAAAETRINNLAASLPEDFTELNNEVSDLKSAIQDIENLEVSIPLAQGARGTNGVIINNAAFVTSQNFYSYKAGNSITVKVQTAGVQIIITEWGADGSYVGNLGDWRSVVNYTFSNKQITFTFKKTSGADISPSDITFNAEVVNPLFQILNETESLIDNDLQGYSLNTYLQGYYGADGQFNSAVNYVCCPMIIPQKEEQYYLPKSDTYDVNYYLWDYNGGVFSNFYNSGWYTTDVRVTVKPGKAFSLVLRNKTETALDVATVTYIYYKTTILGALNLKEWIPHKVACVGDSLTEGVDQTTHVIKENYPYWLGEMLGCKVLNYGVAGADTMEYWYDYLQNFTFDNTIDTVLIMLGTNGGGIPNTLATDVYPYQNYWDYVGSYCGCYCKLIMKIVELTQNRAQIFLLTPPYTTFSTEQLNRVKEARETIKEIGLYYNIPVIDVFGECGMGAYNANVFRPHDGCHFNAKGYHRLGTFIGSKVKSMHSIWMLTDEYDDETPVT